MHAIFVYLTKNSPRDAVTISRTFNDATTLIDISTSLPRSPDEPAYLRPSPPYVRSQVGREYHVPIIQLSHLTRVQSLPGAYNKCSNPMVSLVSASPTSGSTTSAPCGTLALPSAWDSSSVP